MKVAIIAPSFVLDRQQRRDGQMSGVQPAVRQDQDVHAVLTRLVARLEEIPQRGAEPLARRIEQRHLADLERRVVDFSDALEFLLGQNRRRQLQHGAVLRIV